MKLKVKEFNIYIDEIILIVGVLCLLFKGIRDYFSNFFMCFLFIAFHELSHMFVASILGIKTTKLNIHISGLSINLEKLEKNGVKWLAIFLAGPLSNIILAIMFNKIPLVYTINLALAIINLIPIYPLDGYNILEILLKFLNFDEKKVILIQKNIGIMVIILLVILGINQLVIFKNLSVIRYGKYHNLNMVFYIFIQSSNLRKNCDSAMYQKYYKNVTNF